ncbi:MAG TPA: HNH endonuclease [Azospirillum sp.]
MRPVNLLPKPASYDEAGLKNKKLAFRNIRNSATVSAVAAEKKKLVDKWMENLEAKGQSRKKIVTAGGKVVTAKNDGEKAPVFDDTNKVQNDLDAETYKDCNKSLDNVSTYQEARLGLTTAVGGYCSYCELPLTSSLAVEHKLPKFWFPDRMLNWDNFLLACPICNSIKNDKPNQKELPPSPLTTDKAADKIGTLYGWPDQYWRSLPDKTLLPFTFTLSKIKYEPPPKGNTDWSWNIGDMLNKASIAPLVKRFDRGEGVICRNMFGFANGPATRSRNPDFNLDFVILKISATVGGPIEAAINNTIELTRLNSTRPATEQQHSDLRVAYRTQTYFRALSLRDRYDEAIKFAGIKTATVITPNPFLRTILRAAAHSGFWSVWAYVFQDVPEIQSELMRVFPGTAPTVWRLGA